MAKDNGGKRALIPVENKRHFLDVSGDIVEHVDPVFYGEPSRGIQGAWNQLNRGLPQPACICFLQPKRSADGAMQVQSP